MPTAYINKRETIYSNTFLIQKGDSVFFDFNAGGWHLKMHLSFSVTTVMENNTLRRRVTIEPKDNVAEVMFENWDVAPSMVMSEPLEFGKRNDGKVLWFFASCLMWGAAKQMFVQVVMGDPT